MNEMTYSRKNTKIMKKKIHFVTPVRGFFKHLMKDSGVNAEFTCVQGALYEINGKKNMRTLLKNIARSIIGDMCGFIHTPIANGHPCDLYASSNRFLKADKPYFIYVENPSGLYHYSLARKKSFFGSHKLQKLVKDEKLKALVCMSKACQETFEKVCVKVPESVWLTQIYPLLPDNTIVSHNVIKERCAEDKPLKLLYIAQGDAFLSKGFLEILECYRRIKNSGVKNIQITIVTSFDTVDKTLLSLAQGEDGISVYDFKFDYDGMQRLYTEHSAMIMPTSHDSFNLTVLEGIKSGLPVIGSKLYAIPEMVEDGYNGFLCDPAWWFFDQNNIPNPKVWNHRNKTIFSGVRNERVTRFLYDKIIQVNNDRELLLRLSFNSLYKSAQPPFSHDYIVNQWNELIQTLTNEK